MSEELKKPPTADGPEKSILSSMLQDPVEYVPRAIEMGIKPATFYNPARAKLFSIFVEKQSKGEEIELISLTEELQKSGAMDQIGGPAALSEIYTHAPTGAHFDSHSKDVLNAFTLRAIIRFGTKVISEAYGAENAGDMIAKLELGALTIGQEAQDRTGYDYSLKCAYKELLTLIQSDEGEGLPTGYANIDAVTGGLHPGEVTIIGARPGMGKTAFAISLAENLAIHNGTSTALFAVEGKRTYLTTRLVAMAAHISAKRIRDKQITKGDIQKMTMKMKATKDSPLRIDDRISNAVEIAAKIRRMHQQQPLQVVLIDYIQKLPPSCPEERRDLRIKIKNATDVLHQTCKPLNISLVLLAQLKRDSPKENPTIEMLMESASLEQDGDTVILLGDKEGQPDDVSTPREKLIRIAKNRHGPCADLCLNFTPTTTRFH